MAPRSAEMGSGRLTARIDSEVCVGCGRCVAACPAQAISLGPDGKAVVDESLCRGCG
ncbi:MAG: 4Fe-4S binding protein, partial [candidate division WS1 bacterium]|nr:4Fe-4S binding protein [candidate division WS1 bacterium]